MTAGPGHGEVERGQASRAEQRRTAQQQARTAVADLPASPLRRRRWSQGGELPMRLEVRPTGMVLGPERDGSCPAFALFVPTESTRVGVVGDLSIAQLVALRLLDQDAHLTVVTDRRADWDAVVAAAPDRSVAVLPQLRRWPLDVVPPPWALVVDMAEPPPTGFARIPWSTVVHLSPTVPSGSGWWQSAQLVVATRFYARPLAAIRPRFDPSMIESMDDADLLAVDQQGPRVLRPTLTHREYDVLTTRDRRT